MLFNELPLIEPILKALDAEGYINPTPIQEQSIPIILQRRDLLGCAQTGTGKTAAFALPILQIMQEERRDTGKHAANRDPRQPKRPVKVLILTPTRELAIQIGDSFKAYGRFTDVRSVVIFGGVGQTPQTDALRRGPEVLVATPGRLLDLMNQGFISLSDISVFVLDEADRMLDMGFIHDVKKVIAKLPAKRQTLFFSATMPPEIASLADSILTNPAKVAVTPVSTTAEKVEQAVYFVEKKEKKHLLIHLLKDSNITSALIFTRTKHGANRVAGDLSKAGIRAEAIHGNKSQNARQAALSNFKGGRIRALVATDIAARGIDIDDLTHVINFDLPNIPETYVHRIGRTGRAGASGIAWSFCESEELPYLKDIQKLTGQLVPVVEDHPFAADLQAPALPQAAPPRSKEKQKANNRRDGRSRPPASQRSGDAPQQVRKENNPQQKQAPQKPQPEQRPAVANGKRETREKPAAGTGGGGKSLIKKRFASILEVATIEKQAFSRRDRQEGKGRDQKPEQGNGARNSDTPPSGGNKKRRNRRRRERGGKDRS
ncbi:MAG: DEAD/DEAH box helicase [Saprospiraceae bacterium]